MPQYRFQRAHMSDLAMLTEWQLTPHVQKWWDDEELFDEDELADLRVRRWIVSLENTPFAYIQDYTVHGWGDHHFDHLPDGSRGIDQFIGLADMVGKGHGQRFIARHCQWLFQEGAPVIGTDPHPDNRVAIAVYRKVGFETEGAVKDTPWGTILPMTLSQKNFKFA